MKLLKSSRIRLMKTLQLMDSFLYQLEEAMHRYKAKGIFLIVSMIGTIKCSTWLFSILILFCGAICNLHSPVLQPITHRENLSHSILKVSKNQIIYIFLSCRTTQYIASEHHQDPFLSKQLFSILQFFLTTIQFFGQRRRHPSDDDAFNTLKPNNNCVTN